MSRKLFNSSLLERPAYLTDSNLQDISRILEPKKTIRHSSPPSILFVVDVCVYFSLLCVCCPGLLLFSVCVYCVTDVGRRAFECVCKGVWVAEALMHTGPGERGPL